MNFNEGNNEQPCVPDAHGFSSLTVNSSQKRQEVGEMVFSERYFENRPVCIICRLAICKIKIVDSKVGTMVAETREKFP